MSGKLGLAGKTAHAFIESKLTPLIIVASLLLGVFAILGTPREEEPQIVVPMADVFVQMPGASIKEVEERVTIPMEKKLWEIPGVEYVYSTTGPGMSMAIVRFYVGQKEEDALVRLYNKMYSNFDLIPQGASQPLIKPRSIDDVPILSLTLWGPAYDGSTLRRVAAQLDDQIKNIADVSETRIIGGERRQVKVLLDPARLAAYHLDPLRVVGALGASNREVATGSFTSGNREVLVETGIFLKSAEEVGNLVVGSSSGRPVYLRDVAQVVDGPEEPRNYVLLGLGPAAAKKGVRLTASQDKAFPAVTLAVAKRKGTNAVVIANHVLEKVNDLRGRLIPSDLQVTITRNYGETAQEKSNELLEHLLLATISVTILIALALGWRSSLVVLIAIPVTLALTLFIYYIYGYTLNRVTLFALIFSIGILVDDAIVVVENITRHSHLPENKGRPAADVAVEAVAEVGNPTILATWTVIAAILPMAFVGGLMGPYMRPIPVGASMAMLFSLFIAFVISPWAARRVLRPHGEHGHEGKEDWTTRLYRRLMTPLLERPGIRLLFLAGVVVLLLAAVALVFTKVVTVKMLPFDNKSEFQVIIDMPEGTPLEETAQVTRAIGNYLGRVPEVTDYEMYVGTSSPYNFNGLVRHYFLRQSPHTADIQVNLLPKGERSFQSHDIAKRVRPEIDRIARPYGARVKISEIPPGPPVLQTLVAEVYGPDYQRQIEVAGQIKEVFEKTPGVVDVDWYVEDPQPKVRLIVDKEKAALNGISTEQILGAMKIGVEGEAAGLAHIPEEKEDVPIWVRLARPQRSSVADLSSLQILSPQGRMIPLRELVQTQETTQPPQVYRKNLKRVVYVTGDVAGKDESPVYAILNLNRAIKNLKIPEGYEIKRYSAQQPFLTEKIAMKWDGEWQITYEVFRDLGIAFGTVLILIYVLVVGWFRSFKTPLVIMAPIPLTLVGILPAHALLGAFFTATSMIGFIAGAGIIVRNSIILVDFVKLRREQGMSLEEAVIDAGAVRFRPMLLTAAAVVVGAFVILFDPIFQGLAISLMAGEVASTLLSRMAVPVLYYMSERKSPEERTHKPAPLRP
ncbi:MAG: efflux RND transporter permease subunit [Candidatus Tectomicrobia bacterium]|uniref:Efflux RND transporter permease subunit n=1 Tax=Tectimicrobiota bacterium TaxID=2528274 RepID=A0A932M1G3_UNCTE|nr:efflux RND transporter permease subunit [Candidatus Tectomicrobia bacterium]